jgi:glycosyltransferase involved in cell wall biosynthesis
MRILHVIHQYLPDAIGGTEVSTHSLSRELQARGHAVAVFCPVPGQAPGLARDSYEGVPVYRAGATWRDALGRVRASFGDRALEAAFAQALDDFRPDVVHFQHLMGLPLALVEQAERAGAARVFTLHDYWVICPNAQLVTNYDRAVCSGPKLWLNCARCAAARIDRPLLLAAAPAVATLLAVRSRGVRRALDRMNALIALSAFMRDLAGAHGLPANKVHLIEQGVQIEPVCRQEPGPSSPVRFIYLGGLAWQKGVHVIVQACRDLDPAQATLTIYGDPRPFPDYVRRLQAEAGPAVRFAGRLERHQVAAALAAGDMLLVPSLWYENSPAVILEAMACGLPVAASALGALAGRVRDGVDGLLLPPGDVAAWRRALTDLALHPERIAQLRRGIRPVRTLAEQVAEMEALYATVVREVERR